MDLTFSIYVQCIPYMETRFHNEKTVYADHAMIDHAMIDHAMIDHGWSLHDWHNVILIYAPFFNLASLMILYYEPFMRSLFYCKFISVSRRGYNF